MTKTHYQHADNLGTFARMYCGQAQHRTGLRGGIMSPNASAVTCARCLAKLAARKAPRPLRVEVEETLTAEEQARIDALPCVPRTDLGKRR